MTIRTPGSLAKLGSPGHLTHITGPKPNFSPAVEFFRRGLAIGEPTRRSIEALRQVIVLDQIVELGELGIEMQLD